jgi:hypothetical protein
VLDRPRLILRAGHPRLGRITYLFLYFRTLDAHSAHGRHVSSKQSLARTRWDALYARHVTHNLRRPRRADDRYVVISAEHCRRLRALGRASFRTLGAGALCLYQETICAVAGSETMVKAKTAYVEVFCAAEGDAQWKNAAVACRGFVGDERAGDEVGRMAFGASAGLDSKRDPKFEGL